MAYGVGGLGGAKHRLDNLVVLAAHAAGCTSTPSSGTVGGKLAGVSSAAKSSRIRLLAASRRHGACAHVALLAIIL